MTEIKDILVIKTGTGTLVENKLGRERLDHQAFKLIGKQIADLSRVGIRPVLVSSAGITAGMIKTGTIERPDKRTQMPELQRLASIGWGLLLHVWDQSTEDLTVGSLLLTRRELEAQSRERDEALRTIHALLAHNELPVINENDSITHEEITFGDNDKLAATLAIEMAGSPHFSNIMGVVMLSNVDGLYERKNDPSSLVRKVEDPTDYLNAASDSDYQNGTGGMTSKLIAASMLASSGIKMWIANGREEDAISRVIKGEIGTYFMAKPGVNVE